jgi:hypothetical protein
MTGRQFETAFDLDNQILMLTPFFARSLFFEVGRSVALVLAWMDVFASILDRCEYFYP